MYCRNGDKDEDNEDIDDDVNLDVHPESGHHSISCTEAPLGKLSLVEQSKTFTTHCDFFAIM